ncbi:MAG: phytoene desaturase family protein [Thermoanaerobaculia bacterium]
MARNVIVVGGGLAGLAASIFLARGGCSVTLFEKRRVLGGRAITHLRYGYRFNLGGHAFYKHGLGASVCRDLGVPIRGGLVKTKGVALINGNEQTLPSGIASLLTTSLLSLRGKMQLGVALLRVRGKNGANVGDITVREWLDKTFDDARARDVMEALLRLSTYSDHANEASAPLALAQMRAALRGTIYIDEGWQRIVDSMHSAAVSAGVHFVSSSRVVGVVQDGAVRAVELGGLELDAENPNTLSLAMPDLRPDEVEGALIPAENVVLAVDPMTAYELAGNVGVSWPKNASPVTAACLDVALRSLPNPKNTYAIGIDQPLYYSVHSQFAQLTPKGGALIHLAKYRKETSASNREIEGGATTINEDERTLEALLDRMQPGWRDVLVHRRFLPSMTVSNAIAKANVPRPTAITPVKGLYIAGDWVGDEGLLSDAALASARTAAKAILNS